MILATQGIFTLLKETESSSCNDPDNVLTHLRELHRSIQGSLGAPLAQLTRLFTLANDNCLENYRLREELQNYNERTEVL